MTGRYICGDALSAVTSLENDEPQHIFLIGLAYLGGIDVEVCRDLSISYSKLGDISQAQGDLAGAKASYEKGLAIFEPLASETGSVDAYDDLAVSYYNMAAASGVAEEQQVFLRKAETI